ncbi:hypothetical protein CsSME_00029156 [Camellia sinensis var. sinensis]
MAEDEPKKVESETQSEAPPAPATAPESAEDKSVTPPPPPPPPPPPVPAPEEKLDDSKALAIVESVPDSEKEKTAEGSINRGNEKSHLNVYFLPWYIYCKA